MPRIVHRVLLCLSLLVPGISLAQQQPQLPADPQALDAYIRDYLLRNPEVVVEAIQRWQAQQAEAEAAALAARLEENHQVLVASPEDPVLGNPDGDVTVVEFMDYNCGFCRRVHPVMEDLLTRDGNIRLVLKEFPVLGPGSIYASQAALAARQQDLYQPFHDAMMSTGERMEEAQVLRIAEEAGLDLEKLLADMQDPAIQALLDRNHALAQALAINGTPSFVIGDEIVRGATDLANLERLVAEARTGQ